ncbi:MAG: S28 family serine protease [Parabacteroides sp.]|nr:S28 family serine protease [Parabacteroides sp.]
MKKTRFTLILLWMVGVALQSYAQELQERLAKLPNISQIEALESAHYTEKYVVRITQPVDHQQRTSDSFKQRVILFHVGFDRPTIFVTEGYGADYALHPRHQEELSKLLNANVIFVEHRYFLESTPTPCNWDFLTAENSAYDLHQINQTFKKIYNGKWISTGISKGGQTTCLYRAYFPDDVDFSVPYVAPLNKGVEDGRHEPFLRKVGTKKERKQIEAFQKEILKRKEEIVPLLAALSEEKKYKFRISMPEVLDYCVLEYPFALWQWGTSTETIPSLDAETSILFDHLVTISGPEYFAEDQPYISFFVQAARELGYYGYDTKPFKKYLSIKESKGYLNRIMLPQELVDKIEFRPDLYQKVYRYLQENDPKMICIYGEVDPWSATRIPDFKDKKNLQIYIQPGGSHLARISNMPKEIQEKIMAQINQWLAE